MPGLENFENEIESRLDARRTALEEKELPALRQHFRKMQSGYQAIYNVLRKKGFLKEDPYKYEERLSELDTPSMPHIRKARRIRSSASASDSMRRGLPTSPTITISPWTTSPCPT
jgi:hypothetical protein